MRRMSALIIIAAFVAGSCATGADDLTLGDCFEVPEANSFSQVDISSCAEPHEAQIYGNAFRLDTGRSGLSGVDMSDVEEQCFNQLLKLDVELVATLPEDLELSTITRDRPNQWWCVVSSEGTGLDVDLTPEFALTRNS